MIAPSISLWSVVVAAGAIAVPAVVLTVGVSVPLALVAVAVFGCVARPNAPTAVVLLLVCVGVRAEHVGYHVPLAPTRSIDAGAVELRSDPRPTATGWWARAEIDGHIVLLVTDVGVATGAGEVHAGDRLEVSGVLIGEAPATAWARSHRIGGRLSVYEIHAVRPSGGAWGVAAAVRSHLRSSVEHLDPGRRALYTGLTFGDDRFQEPADADDFRAAGLGHLLAVSGQNVVFVLALTQPILRWIRPLPLRLGALLTVLVLFGFVTRFEPSVVRAVTMAAMIAGAHALGLRSTAISALPAAVVVLMFHDPLLSLSVGFQLSVAATAGLVVLGPVLLEQLPSDGPVALALAGTVGAQLGVAPLLVVTFDGVSLAAVPANLLAGPAAGFVMMWGIAAGGVAGFADPWLARLLHLPTEVGLWWIDSVASVCGRLPIAGLGWGALVGVVFAALLAIAGRLRWAHVVVAGLVVAPVVFVPAAATGLTRITGTVELVRMQSGHDVLIIEGGADPEDTIASIRRARVGRIDLVLVLDDSRAAGRLVAVLRNRFEFGPIYAPPGHSVPGARAVGIAELVALAANVRDTDGLHTGRSPP